MSFTPKRWTSLGLGLALLGTSALAACSGEQGEQSNTASTSIEVGEAGESGEQSEAGAAGEQGEGGESGEHGESGEGGEAGEGGAAALSLPERLAFMSGHVEAGLALYRAGEAQMAAKHLSHPVSETHAAEREGLDALGFDAEVFETVSSALKAGIDAGDIEDQLAAAETNLANMARQAGGEPA